jgi:hypothetical protein
MAKHDPNRPMYHSGNTHEQFATLYEGSQVTKSENSFDPPPPPPPGFSLSSHGPDDKEDPPIKEEEKEKEEEEEEEKEPEMKSFPGPNGAGLGALAPTLPNYQPVLEKPQHRHGHSTLPYPAPSIHRHDQKPPPQHKTQLSYVHSSSTPAIPPVGMGSDTTPKVKPPLITDKSSSSPAAPVAPAAGVSGGEASAAASAGPGAAAASGVVGMQEKEKVNPMVDHNQMSMSSQMPSQILAPAHSSDNPVSSSVLRSGFNIDDLGAEADSDLLLDRAKGDIRMKTIAQVSNQSKKTKTKKEKLNVGEGETQNNWRFNGPYDSPPGITDPRYLQIQDMVAKKEGDLLEHGYVGVHKSLWKQTHTARGAPMQRQAYYSYNHSKQLWKKVNEAERNRWQNKRSEKIKNGTEMQGEIDAKRAKTLADIMNKKRKRIEDCGCGPGRIDGKKGIHKQM